MNPARVEAVDHLGARFGAAFRHALTDEEFSPFLAWDRNCFDIASESTAQCLCNVVRGILLGARNLDVPGAFPLFTQNIRAYLAEVDYIYSRLPNAVNDHQNDLRVSTGIAFRFGPR
jgi:hypothetical protein